jgi:hypothetical protein
VPYRKGEPYFGAEATISFLLNSATAFRCTASDNTPVRVIRSKLDFEGYATEVGLGVFVGAGVPNTIWGICLALKYHYGQLPLVNSAFTHVQHAVLFLAKLRLTIQDKCKMPQ